MRSMGMVQVSGKTYRIVRLRAGLFQAIRILDDAEVGKFFYGPPLQVTPGSIQFAEMRAIAREAVRHARTNWLSASAVPG